MVVPIQTRILRTFFIPPRRHDSPKLMIVIHGRGDSLEGFLWVPSALGLEDLGYLLVNAPDPYFTGYSWYGLAPDQGPGVRRSRALLIALLEELHGVYGYAYEDIAFMGFSQGCAMSVDVGLRFGHRLGAVVGISGHVHFLEEYPAAFSEVARHQRILITHGNADDLLPLATTRSQVEALRGMGVELEWEVYPKGHTIDMEDEIPRIREFLMTHCRFS